jgi:hypothetical protein
MIFTFGLPWIILAAALARSAFVAILFVGAYLVLRIAIYMTVGVWGLRDSVVRRAWWLAPLRDAANFGVWLASFFSDRFYWRGLEYQVKGGLLVPLYKAKDPKTASPELAARESKAGNE